jgi:fluoroacetyl-CoA thioesterase
MLQPGLTHEIKRVVTAAETIHFLGSAVTPALSTPSMIMLLEITARDGVLPHLETGQDSVGTIVNVAHLAATPLGMQVTYRATLTAIDRRRLTFAVEAWDEKDKIAEGTHERFVIDVARYAERLKAKAGG